MLAPVPIQCTSSIAVALSAVNSCAATSEWKPQGCSKWRVDALASTTSAAETASAQLCGCRLRPSPSLCSPPVHHFCSQQLRCHIRMEAPRLLKVES